MSKKMKAAITGAKAAITSLKSKSSKKSKATTSPAPLALGEKENEEPADSTCNPEPELVTSQQSPAAMTPTAPRSLKNMEITLTRSNAPRKDPRLVIYNLGDRQGSVQFLSTLFGGSKDSVGNPPATLVISGEFAEPKKPAVKMSAEERKAARAAQPKLTLAEKVAKAEERLAKQRAKLAAQTAQPVEAHPSM